MDCLREMGYTEAQARGALQKSNGDPEAAIMFLLDNPDYVGSGTQKTPKEGSFGDSDYNITLQKPASAAQSFFADTPFDNISAPVTYVPKPEKPDTSTTSSASTTSLSAATSPTAPTPASPNTKSKRERKATNSQDLKEQLGFFTATQLDNIIIICGVKSDPTRSNADKIDAIYNYFDAVSANKEVKPAPAPDPRSFYQGVGIADDICPYFQQGFCRNGNYCQFSHSANPSLCIYFQQGYCRDGNSCRFSHASSRAKPSSGDEGKMREQVKALLAFLKNADAESIEFLDVLLQLFSISHAKHKADLENMVTSSMHNESRLMLLLGLSDELDEVMGRLKRITEDVRKNKGKSREDDKSKTDDGKDKVAKPSKPPKPVWDPKNTEEFECPICMDEVEVGEGYVFEECKHTYCKVCLTGYLEDKITEGNVLDVPCMCPDCPTTFQYSDIKNLVDKEMFDKYEEFSFMAALKADPFLRWCPNPKSCGNAILGDPSTTKVKCDLCDYEFCFLCNEEWHIGTCDDYQKWKEENGKADDEFAKWKKENSKPCPKCKARIQKNAGCNHITCSNCHYQWCWLCDGKYSSNHYDPYNLLGCPGLQFSGTDDAQTHHVGSRMKGKALAVGTVVVGVPAIAAVGVGAVAVAPFALGGYAIGSAVKRGLKR